MNDNLISRSALKEHKFVSIDCYLKSNVDNGFSQYKQGWNDAIDEIINNAPTVDAYTEDDVKTAIKEGHEVGYEMAKVKFERPIGEWKHNGFCVTTTQYKCSECGMHSLDRSKYCPFCGADMRGGRE